MFVQRQCRRTGSHPGRSLATAGHRESLRQGVLLPLETSCVLQNRHRKCARNLNHAHYQPRYPNPALPGQQHRDGPDEQKSGHTPKRRGHRAQHRQTHPGRDAAQQDHRRLGPRGAAAQPIPPHEVQVGRGRNLHAGRTPSRPGRVWRRVIIRTFAPDRTDVVPSAHKHNLVGNRLGKFKGKNRVRPGLEHLVVTEVWERPRRPVIINPAPHIRFGRFGFGQLRHPPSHAGHFLFSEIIVRTKNLVPLLRNLDDAPARGSAQFRKGRRQLVPADNPLPVNVRRALGRDDDIARSFRSCRKQMIRVGVRRAGLEKHVEDHGARLELAQPLKKPGVNGPVPSRVALLAQRSL